ncbi:MAG TPA: 4'-phosphopantetheinyl transferase superfamily protein [Micromonosporaceae bacterium]|nr:4'-phosphopantetheinyl transferase superfamily protein [Micromonosporaceae bacterium]
MTIEAILPTAVVSAEATDDDPAAGLLPEEEAFISGAVDRRRREYATVRHCARRALVALGLPPVPIPSGIARDPLWPPGIVGSMTHCEGYRAAAVARATMVRTIGIDAEPNEPLPNGLVSTVLTSRERVAVSRLAVAAPTVRWDRLLFSAKEAVYKAWYPLMRVWLGFEDVEIALNLNQNAFVATLTPHDDPVAGGSPRGTCSGRWMAVDGLLITAVAPAASLDHPLGGFAAAEHATAGDVPRY